MKRWLIGIGVWIIFVGITWGDVGSKDLLDLAFAGVSKMPLNPHIKNRSRAQEKAIDVYLELGEDRAAETKIKYIENWRRWMAFANLAHFYAKKGDGVAAEKVRDKVLVALQMVDEIHSGKVLARTPSALIDSLEGWRYKNVRVRLYETDLLLGKKEVEGVLASLHLTEDLSASLAANRAVKNSIKYKDAMIQLSQLADTTNFEVIEYALVGMVRLADVHYQKINPSEWVEKELIIRLKHTPVFTKINVLEKMVKVALQHNDVGFAKKLCVMMEQYIHAAALPVELRIVEKVRVIRLRLNAGSEANAKKQLDKLCFLYEQNLRSIVDINRAHILCRLAEAAWLAGEKKQALSLYKKAIVAGQINPNSRPRADALNEICCSMARYFVPPTQDLFHQLQEMSAKLGRPW